MSTARVNVSRRDQAKPGDAKWYRGTDGVLHFICPCGEDVRLGAHSADLSGDISPEVDCGNAGCDGARSVTLSGFNGGADSPQAAEPTPAPVSSPSPVNELQSKTGKK